MTITPSSPNTAVPFLCPRCGARGTTDGKASAMHESIPGDVAEIVRELRDRKLFFLNGGSWMMSPLPDPFLQQAADTISRLSAETERWEGRAHRAEAALRFARAKLIDVPGAENMVAWINDVEREATVHRVG